MNEEQVVNRKQAFLRMWQLSGAPYMTDVELIILIHDVAMARSIVATIRQVVKENLSSELLAQNRQTYSGYWRVEQGHGADIILQMRLAWEDAVNFPKVHAYCRGFRC